jgi:hypothetical protein
MREEHPLAFDIDGNPIDLPLEAKAWRVRRGGGRRGRPRAVFDPDTGLQLDVQLSATIDDLIERGCKPGRYRLEAVDADGRVMPGLVAVVEVSGEDDEDERESERPALAPEPDPLGKALSLVGQLVVAHCQTMAAMASAFGTVRPAHEEPSPIVLAAQPPARDVEPPSGLKPEQLMQMVMQVGQMLAGAWKAGTAQAAPVGGAS